METLLDMLRRKDLQGIWKRFCGFLDVSAGESPAVQDALLEEQFPRWRKSRLVRRIFGGGVPETVREFRESAPLTTYDDCADVLPAHRL